MNPRVALAGALVASVSAFAAGYLTAVAVEVPDGHGWLGVLLGILVGTIVFVGLWFATVVATIASDTA